MKKITITDIKKEYFGKIDALDLDLILVHILKKPREFVLAHPEFALTKNQKLKTTNFLASRMRDEPLAYILGYKEFFGHPFLVSPATLIPRPETELMVEEALDKVRSHQSSVINVIDVGTGSGNIIISILKNLVIDSKFKIQNSKFFAIDISKEALKIAKKNAKINGVTEKIRFLQGSLLEPFIKTGYKPKTTHQKLIILANLPYLSREVYNATLPNVKKYEPKSALYSPKEGLEHYEKLLQQVSNLKTKNYQLPTTLLLEISPEQKTKLPKIIKKYLPKAKIEFKKDLSGKWRVCKIETL